MIIVAILVNVGMWMERFVIIVVSLTRTRLPTAWGDFLPTWIDVGMFIGSFGLFFMMFLLFCRYLPMVARAEVKTILPQAHAGQEH
jgi:molybdopterin-containing oxidoreductase family membrane subunit